LQCEISRGENRVNVFRSTHFPMSNRLIIVTILLRVAIILRPYRVFCTFGGACWEADAADPEILLKLKLTRVIGPTGPTLTYHTEHEELRNSTSTDPAHDIIRLLPAHSKTCVFR
jgi:hypothetical protein